jgi:uncharacterized membrane protein YtjA (UPF0391 family)
VPSRLDTPAVCSPADLAFELLLMIAKDNPITMFHYAVVFLIIALIAALFGFGVIASTAAGIAKILFMVFLVLFVVSLLMGRRAQI